MRKLAVTIAVAFLAVSLGSTAAFAGGGAINIGGKTTATVVISVISAGGSTNLVIGSTLGYITPGARHEFAAGLFVSANFGFASQTYSPVVEYRINSNLLGAEENILLYIGAVAGVNINSGPLFTTTLGNFGPKGGAEYYVSSNVALQLEERAMWDTNGRFTNQVTLGLKVLF